ncbi:hypothetical protein [Nocardia sp. NPDC059239]|uniref:hypothetical protein n=1 Tax=Nocardia sp. NPDC059239 TaxID=3346785 RepID=UPI0036879BBA
MEPEVNSANLAPVAQHPYPEAAVPISHLLYLAAATEGIELVDIGRLSILRHSATALVRGDPASPLAGLESVMADAGPERTDLDDLTALRLVLLSLIDAPRACAASLRALESVSDQATQVVARCVQANQMWSAGDLSSALCQHQIAVHSAAATAQALRVYARLLLSKRLVDVQITERAAALVDDVQRDVERYGLYAFESVSALLA